MTAPDEPRELGTLVVVVGKARNLVNKSRFGKQDPFCTVTYSEDKQRTKAIKRGGQHPEWDEELRFTILEDADDILARTQSASDGLTASTSSASSLSRIDSPGVTTAQALATKSRKGPLGKKGGKSMRLACYADDAKEPELIGECAVSIDDVLKLGEVDEWYDILYKEKYSGEVYLELTFFSNDAPPVKRNVPRPSVHNYGGAGVFDAGPSSLPPHHRLSGGISSSGSVSGMSLYIPPYVKPPISSTANPVPALQPSSSFANLGIPPAHRQQTPLPSSGQSGYPPSHAPQSSHNLSIDALTRPMSSMSLASNGSVGPPQPLPLPSHVQAPHHAHRHSVGSVAEAPWGSLLPQSSPTPTPAPHPRPMSSNDAAPWQQPQKIEDGRRMGGATPVPRPITGQGHAPHWQDQQDPYRTITPTPPVPSAPQAGAPPAHYRHHHASSFSGPSRPFVQQNTYTSPPPDPFSHPNSAPPIPPNHYNVPASSFSGIAQSLVDSSRPSSVQPGYGQPYDSYQGYPPSQDHPGHQQQQYDAPPRQSSYPVQSSHPQHPHRNSLPDPPRAQSRPPPTPPRDSYNSQQVHQAPQQNGYEYQQPVQATPASQPPATANPSGYVPWYQQTQAAQAPPLPPVPTPQTDHYSYPPQSSYGSLPPAVPNHRPIPNPPPPPKSSSGGYYPSDELYAAQQQLQPQQQQQPPWQQQQQQQQQQPSLYATPAQQLCDPPYAQAQSHPPPQSTSSAAYNSVPDSYQPSPTPTPQSHHDSFSSTTPNWQSQPNQSYGRSPSPAPPAPPPQPQQPQQFYPPQFQQSLPPQPYRAPSPQPYSAPSPQPYRAPSPQPYPNAASHSLVPPHHSALPSSRTPSPSPGLASRKQDWRSYMQNLGTTSATQSPSASQPQLNNFAPGPDRTASPQPPPKDWYTPPPVLPTSIRPPDGWQSTLPPDHHQRQQQQQPQSWRG